MSEMQSIILQSAEKILSKHMTKQVIEETESGLFPAALWESLQQSGLLLIGVSDENGGHGGDFADGFSLIQLAGKYSAPIPIAETLISNWLLAEIGIEASAEAKSLSCLYASSKSDILLERGYLTGRISYIPYGRHVKQAVTFLRNGGEDELLIVPIPAVTVQHDVNLAGEPRDTCQIEQLPINEAEHYSITEALYERTVYLGALARAAQMTGAMERIMELAIEHVETRYQFGKPLSRQQAIQHHIAALAGELANAKAALNNAVASLDGSRFQMEVAMAKLRLNEAAGVFAKTAHQIMAAIGFTHEHTLHYSTRRLWSYRDEFGTEAEWSNIIANQLKTHGKNGLWGYLTEQSESKGEGNERLTIYR